MRSLAGISVAIVLVSLGAGGSAVAQRERRLGVGLRSTGQTIAGDYDPDNKLHLAGGGLQLRYRLRPRFTVELTLEGLHADEAGGSYVRDTMPATLALFYHVMRHVRWDPYLLLGVGGSDTEVEYRNASGSYVTESFHESHVHVGAGIERRIGRLGLGAELRLVGLKRSADDGDGARYGANPYGPVAASSSGGQVSLTMTYYF